MTKTTKLWISPALELRHAINGWPELPPRYFTHYVVNGEIAETGQRAAELYTKALAKAKEESIPFEKEEDNRIRVQIPVPDIKPDTFIDLEGKVEVVDQYFDETQKEWFDYYNHTNKAQIFNRETRQVARLKPVQSNPVVIPDQSDYATEEEFFEACKERRKMMNGDVE